MPPPPPPPPPPFMPRLFIVLSGGRTSATSESSIAQVIAPGLFGCFSFRGLKNPKGGGFINPIPPPPIVYQSTHQPSSGLMGKHPTSTRSRPFPNCGSNIDWEINQDYYRNLEKVVILHPLDIPTGEGISVGLRDSLVKSIKYRYVWFRRLRCHAARRPGAVSKAQRRRLRGSVQIRRCTAET